MFGGHFGDSQPCSQEPPPLCLHNTSSLSQVIDLLLAGRSKPGLGEGRSRVEGKFPKPQPGNCAGKGGGLPHGGNRRWPWGPGFLAV